MESSTCMVGVSETGLHVKLGLKNPQRGNENENNGCCVELT